MPTAELLHTVPDAFYSDVSPRFDKAYRDVEKPSGERSLTEEMQYLRNHWQDEGLPSNWVDLPSIGFMVNAQIGFLDSDKFGIGISSEEKKELWNNLTEFSLRSWVREYLQEALVFAGQLSLKNTGGKWSLIDSHHGAEMDTEDTLSKKERNGAVWRAYNEKAKPFLANASHGSIAFITSPAGPSGIMDEDGREIVYVDSHHDILVKWGDQVFEWTIRTDFLPEEHRELIKRLSLYSGQPESSLNKQSPVEDYVENLVCVDSSKTPIFLKQFVSAMEQVRLDVSGKNTAYKNKSWDEVYNDIGLKEELWRYDDKTDNYIEEFWQLARHESDRQRLKMALSTTIIRLSKYVLGQKQISNITHSDVNNRENMADTYRMYGYIYEEMQKLIGCAGGGIFQSEKASLFGDGIGEGRRTLCCTCPHCGKQVEAVIESGTISCPSCNKSAPWKEESVTLKRQRPRMLQRRSLLSA